MTQHSELFDLVQKRRRIARRQRPYAHRRSQLELHRAAILALHREGASLGDIRYYLRALAKPSVSVERSTIKRFLDRIQDASPETS